MTTIRLLPALLFASALAAHAAFGPIRIDVEQRTSPKAAAGTGTAKKTAVRAPGPGGDPMPAKTQYRDLAIKLTNNSNDAFASVTVKYWFFARELGTKNHDQQIMKQGERNVTLAARGREIVETESVTSTYVEAHSFYNLGGARPQGGNPGQQAQLAAVPASGKKITGYAVQVMNEGKVVAEYYSEDSFKRLLAGDGDKALNKTKEKPRK